MYRIIEKKELSRGNFLFRIEAKYVSMRCLPGQFVIVRADADGERLPFTICDYDRENETITLVFQVVGAESLRLSRLQEGECLKDVVGPLGQPSEFTMEDKESLSKKRILFVAGGVGAAPVYPQVKYLHDLGIKSDVIIGAKNKELLLLTEEFQKISSDAYIATDDGSEGTKGLVTDVIKTLYHEQNKRYDLCVAIGSMIMMKFVCILTKSLGLPTVVSMNPIMVDGTGMCGACRLIVGGQVKFACVDGPEFDGHLVDFDAAMNRMKLYQEKEGRDYLRETEKDTHSGGCGLCR